MYLLDTDHCVFLLRRDESVCREFDRRANESAHISIVTAGELLFGAYWSSRSQQNVAETNRLLDHISILSLTRPIMDRFAQLKVGLLRQGQGLEDPDLQIAATALDSGLTLVTHNTAHYKRIPDLRIEDWYR